MFAVSGPLILQAAANTTGKGIKIDSVTHSASPKEHVTGTVLDASTKQPAIGVNISVEGYSAAITDEKGKFRIAIPSPDAVLKFSAPGYTTKILPVRGESVLRVLLNDESARSFSDEISSSVASGKTSRLFSVSAVSNVVVRDSYSRPFENADNYLQAQVPGLNVIRRSGTPGVGSNLVMRGFSSMYGTNQPLIVVDGMLYDANSYGTSLIGSHISNPLSLIDIKDIESFTVIKDGTSLYGTRGANGVIIISTAHAKELATKIDFSVYGGVNMRPEKLPVMGVGDYRLYLSDLLRSSGLPASQVEALPYMNDNTASPDYYRYHYNTDWQDKTLSGSYDQNYYMKVSGGDDIAKYALSVGYLSNKGIIDNTDLKRYSARFNADFNLTTKLTAKTNIAFTSADQSLADQGLNLRTNPLLLGLTKSPFLPVMQVADDGTESPNLAGVDVFNMSNPVAVLENVNAVNKHSRFFGSVRFNYKTGKFGNIGSLVGLAYSKVRESYFVPRLGVAPDTLSNTVAYSTLSSRVQRYSSIYNDTYYSYKRSFSSAHTLEANAGFRYQSSENEQDRATGYNSPSDDFVTIGYSSNSLREIGGDMGKWRWLNAYLGINYSYKSKYLLAFNASADGSSRFGKEARKALKINGNTYALLPSVGAAWIMSSESFMKDVRPVDLLKFRVSYGLSGNDDIGNFTSRRYYVSQNLLGNQGLIRGNIGNPYLSWERSRKLNAGMDISLFNERLSATVDVFQTRITDLVTYNQVPAGAGFDFVVANNGGMKNRGIEASVNARLLNSTLKWDVGAIVSVYRNKVTSLPGGSPVVTTYSGGAVISRAGGALNEFYGFRTQGVFASDAEAKAASQQVKMADGSFRVPGGGDIHFADLNNDGVIDDRDRTVIGNPNPDFTGGIQTTLAWKKFSLQTIFSFSKGNDVYNGTRAILESGSMPVNQTAAMNNRWQYDGQATDIPKVTYGDPMGNARFSDRWIEDGTYLRLRTLNVTYSLPVKTRTVKSASIYLTGNNLFTITKYLGYDPEMGSGGSPLTMGYDIAQEPQFRSVQLGVRVGL